MIVTGRDLGVTYARLPVWRGLSLILPHQAALKW